jgi:hypothetical protein
MPKVRGQHTCIACYSLYYQDDPLIFPEDELKAKRTAIVTTFLRKGPYCNTCLAALVDGALAAQEVANGKNTDR